MEEQVRIIVSEKMQRFARGWHCLGLTEWFRDGKPHKVKAFGTELVVFEGEISKKLNVINAFCPHLGGNLAEGVIKGDSIACPFHDWRWDGEGKCTGIPYAKRVPPRARTQRFVTCEENKQLFVWYDQEGSLPTDNVIIPRLEGSFSDTWSDWDWSFHELNTTGRELIDNLVDVAHFFYIHGEGKGGGSSYFKNVFEDHFATQYLEIGPQPENPGYARDQTYQGDVHALPCWNRGETTYHGPAYLVSRLMFKLSAEDSCEAIEILAQYPIDEENFALHMGFIVRDNPNLSKEYNAERAKQVAGFLRRGTLQDVHIWETKTKIDNPLLCDSDGPLYQLRRWYEQFYVDVADIKPEMVNRFEAETDTRHALPVWEQQAAEKIAQEQAAGIKAGGDLALSMS
ncbi:aromatic ring-hydroxylating dioxygenase subunit alpha [Pseudomonas sp. 5P_3.1_Bac2]|uniref:aromatic ring-hydroxylating dioxygenase subunit alpha n=1 Tax=Pseudomonas sp. 5P_3.1_Bac2 TaxID=2971617 RepID=UPI0021C655EF|nr:aromatic ring-hydroxylating dioxygenase subunit alpha [Pseudomonas sp. 5P_3.1_Bac2]MCU1717650.1 aromatic ring-hydroxylating dioxygenase subunit alpha [Pseudomonas sp. 5P_3.1_Bac2]